MNYKDAKNKGKLLMLTAVLVGLYDFSIKSGILFLLAVALIFIGLILYVAGGDAEEKMKSDQAREQAYALGEDNARATLRNIFAQAGNTPAEVEEKAKLAETLLGQGVVYWAGYSPTRLSEVIQAVEALRSKK
jgi:hypothetical protein